MNLWTFEKSKVMSVRMIGLIALCLILMLILIMRLFYLQILQGDKYLLMAEKNRLSVHLTMPQRGHILDRNGVILAENKKTFRAVLVKENAVNYRETLDNFLKLIEIDPEEIDRIQKELKYKRAFMPVRLKENLTLEEMIKIQLNLPDLSGIDLEEGMMRYYPAGRGNTHTVGYVSLLSEKDVNGDLSNPLFDLPGYRIGRTGIEKAFEDSLKGKTGRRQSEVNAAGRTVRILDEEKSENGQDIVLSVDSRLQNEATKLLEKYAASAIIMNIHTGEIIVFVSAPGYDNNLFTVAISHKNYNKLLNDPHRPLQNKALTGVYSPGSIFKLVVGLAGLESGDISLKQKVNCQGKTQIGNQYFHCWKKDGHGRLNLQEALMHSCDVYFYEMAQKIGPEKILKTAESLGFGSPVNIGIQGESSGLIPSDKWLKKNNKKWHTGDTLNLSIGQGFLNATPIQIATAVARIASGKEVHPTLIKTDTPPEFNSLPYSPIYLRALREGMNMVVNQSGGTAYGSHFNLNGKKMAGKTASTQVRRISMKEREEGIISQDDLPEQYRDHAIFAAFAPVDKPKYAGVVLVEHGGGGSRTAAPLMKELMKKVLELDKGDKK